MFTCILVVRFLFILSNLHENKCDRPNMRQRDNNNNIKEVIKRLKSIKTYRVECGPVWNVECFVVGIRIHRK